MPAFDPKCLTVSLDSGCNLDCTYCYKAGAGPAAPKLGRAESLEAVAGAAEAVARACRRGGRRFTFGFQGAGEPFLDRELLESADSTIRANAARYGLRTYSFITTNGTADEAGYRWAAERFDRICLSIDGPAAHHDAARPFVNGGPTSDRVRRTAALLNALGKTPVCRATVTAQSAGSMPEAAAFLAGELGLRAVQFEPVYGHLHLQPEPELFVRGLLAAREIAARYGGRAEYSGSRAGETHGPHCQTRRGVLFLTRRGLASACLFRNREGGDSPFTVGQAEGRSKFRMDVARLAGIDSALAQLPEACRACEVRDHCARAAPTSVRWPPAHGRRR